MHIVKQISNRQVMIIILSTMFLIPPLAYADDVLLNPQKNKIYFFSEDNRTISIIDDNNNKIISTIHLEDRKQPAFNFDFINNNFIPIVGIILGSVTAYVGLSTYRQSQALKMMALQKDIVFPLVEEFDKKSPGMDLAKDILQEIKILPTSSYDAYGIYNNARLKKVLIHHSKRNEEWDKGDGYVRVSFDELLDFFSRLEYLKSVGVLKDEDTRYFRYHIDKIINSEAVMNYIKDYEFPFYGYLDSRLDYRK